MEDTNEEITATDLASRVRLWRGKVSAREAADLLGIPQRTLEGIEQGRGFSYPRLLLNALEYVLIDARRFAPKELPERSIEMNTSKLEALVKEIEELLADPKPGWDRKAESKIIRACYGDVSQFVCHHLDLLRKAIAA